MSEPADNPQSEYSSEYTGETRARKKWLTILLTYFCPGLGLMYVGQLLQGLLVNLLFLLGLELFLIWWSVDKFFPLLPFVVFLAAWFVFASLIALDNLRRIRPDQAYVLKPYNHWTLYLVVYLLSFVLPIALTGAFVGNNFWRLDTVKTEAMLPGLQPGDVVLSDINELHIRAPERGEMVAMSPPGAAQVEFLRVVAAHGDMVRMEGDTLYVNDDAIAHSPLAPEVAEHSDFDESSGLLALVEHNQGTRYVIAVSPRVFSDLSLPPTELAADNYFLLTDNRSQVPLSRLEAASRESASTSADEPIRPVSSAQIRDSRHFGTVGAREIKGKPRYIFWSTGPDGRTRWDRIGLKTQ